MTTIKQLLQESQLSKLDTRVLLSEVTKFTAAQLISRDDYNLTTEQLNLYQLNYERAQKGEPIAYIIGRKEFFGRNFIVNNHTLIPRPETELLVEEVIKLAPKNAHVLDLGTGSGCIAISCKLERSDLQVSAVDISAQTLEVAIQNANQLNANINFIRSDWFENISGKFDIIVSNPPYIELDDPHLEKLQYEPQSALTDYKDGLSCINNILKSGIKYMNSGAYIIIEHGYNQGDSVSLLFKQNNLTRVETKFDYAQLERFTIGCYKA